MSDYHHAKTYLELNGYPEQDYAIKHFENYCRMMHVNPEFVLIEMKAILAEQEFWEKEESIETDYDYLESLCIGDVPF